MDFDSGPLESGAVPSQLSQAPASSATDPQVIVDFVYQVVQRRSAPALGTHLASAVKARFPDFHYRNYDVVGFRDLISKFAPHITEVGRQGGDLLYAYSEVIAPATQTVRQLNPAAPQGAVNIWRAFSSPNSQRLMSIQVHAESGAWRSVDPGMPGDEFWHPVPPMTTEELRQIASRFVDTVEPGELKDTLSATLLTERWWLAFHNGIRKTVPEYVRFHRFRLDEITQTLRHRLGALQLKNGTIEMGLRRALLTREGVNSKPSSPPEPLPAFQSPAPELRQLLIKLVEHMSESDMREIRVRVGDVLDALAARPTH